VAAAAAEKRDAVIEIAEILYNERTIRDKVSELAARISRDYASEDVLLVSILKGAVVFTADLMRAVTIPVSVDFVHVSRYGMSADPSSEILIKKGLDTDMRDKHVLLVDTIVDTGETLACLFGKFTERSPASINAVVLLDKKCRRTIEVPIAYRGFEIPDKFTVGYGMDFAEQYRNLPYIAVVKITPEAR
jgi:hypoxanthine phosphoribosyltransferase